MRRTCSTFAPRSWVAVAAGLAVAALASPAAALAHDGGRADPVASLVVRERAPFGRLYEGILLVKLLLFALLLASGAGLARRAHRVWSEDVAAGDGVLRLGLRRLGVYGVVFVASAPLIVAAAVALRYVHILSHVAESSG